MTAGAILAGGKGRRFGADKARARWGERTFLEHVAAAMHAAGFRPVLVVGGTPDGLPAGVAHVPDRWPGEGPLAGTLAALLAHPGDVLVAACDMVRLDARVMLRLVEFAGPEPVVVPVWRDSIQPMCALYRPAALVSLAEDFAAGERSLLNALAHLPIREVDFDPEDLAFTNVNTPEDLRALDHAGGGAPAVPGEEP